MQTLAAMKEGVAALNVAKERLEMNNLQGEEDPFIEDCETAIAMLEDVIEALKNV